MFHNSITDRTPRHRFSGIIQPCCYPSIAEMEIVLKCNHLEALRKLDVFLFQHKIIAFKDPTSITLPLNIKFRKSVKNSRFKGVLRYASSTPSIAKEEFYITSTSDEVIKILADYFKSRGLTIILVGTSIISIPLDWAEYLKNQSILDWFFLYIQT